MEIQTYVSGVAAVCVTVWAIFRATEKAVDRDFACSLGARLVKLQLSEALREWPSVFVSVFAAIFGSNPLSLRFVVRSCLFSLILVPIVTGIYIVASPSYTLKIFLHWNYHSATAEFIIKSLTANLIADYFSLIETFLVIRLLAHVQRIWFSPIVLVLDVILTAAIFILWIGVWESVTRYVLNGEAITFAQMWSYVVSHFQLLEHLPSDEAPLRGLIHFSFFTTFATSIWIWLFVGASSLAALGNKFGPLWTSVATGFLNMKTRPFTAIGYLACIFIICVSFILGVGLWISA